MKCATMLPSINKESFWPSRQQLDIAAYTYSYHMKHGCAEELDHFHGCPTQTDLGCFKTKDSRRDRPFNSLALIPARSIQCYLSG